MFFPRVSAKRLLKRTFLLSAAVTPTGAPAPTGEPTEAPEPTEQPEATPTPVVSGATVASGKKASAPSSIGGAVSQTTVASSMYYHICPLSNDEILKRNRFP